MKNLEELKSIIDSAPEGTTHVCYENGTHYQFKILGLNAEIYSCDGWLCYSGCALPDLDGVRSLSDIKQIIELMEEVEALKANTVNCNGGVKCSDIPNNLAM